MTAPTYKSLDDLRRAIQAGKWTVDARAASRLGLVPVSRDLSTGLRVVQDSMSLPFPLTLPYYHPGNGKPAAEL